MEDDELGSLLSFGLVKLKHEGDIIDPDDMTWEHDPVNGDCEQCKARYQKWLKAYKKQEANRAR